MRKREFCKGHPMALSIYMPGVGGYRMGAWSDDESPLRVRIGGQCDDRQQAEKAFKLRHERMHCP